MGKVTFLTAQRSAVDRCQGNVWLKDEGLRRAEDSPPQMPCVSARRGWGAGTEPGGELRPGKNVWLWE